jgi:hypothetical protein
MEWWKLRGSIRALLQRVGLDVTTCRRGGFPFDFDHDHIEIIERVKPFTMTSNERLFGLIEAVRYVLRANVAGGFAECGVYKGGSMMAVALTLLKQGCSERGLYLYDTFAGMTEPTAVDVDLRGRAPRSSSTWAIAALDQVEAALRSTGYPESALHFIAGKVEDTLPDRAPTEPLALLRLDTDWYESTKHELVHLFPRLSPGGVLIVDDYGHYRGARLAVDEYLSENKIATLLHRMDYSGRMCIKH